MFEYKAQLVKVIDGDTIDIDIDLGFHIVLRQRCRLQGVNCPEARGLTKEAGDQATEFVRTWFQSGGDPVTVQSSKPYPNDKYGRFLVVVHGKIAAPSLNDALLSSGNAVPYMV